MLKNIVKLIGATALSLIPFVSVSANTTYTEKYFQLILPSGWRVISRSPDFFQYRSRNNNENLSISVYPLKDYASDDELPNVVKEYLDVRLKKERNIAQDENLQISSIKQFKENDAIVASYNGVHPSYNRRYASFIIAKHHVLVNYYFEAYDMTQQQFDTKCKIIMEKVNTIG